ncbi:MAG TPA: type III pantothenate kinase [Steroidobacteraceae bacterium]|nr:type III pantothenate kinase [Steroidobacteraceae bacterium]
MRPGSRSRQVLARSSQARAAALLVDIGNTRIKWAIWRAGRPGRMRAAFNADWSRADYERELFGERVSAIIVASVAATRVNHLVASAARRACGIAPRFIATPRRAAGVTTRYVETWRLGVDRFAGVAGARVLLGARAACVVNAGTAVTIDLLDASGVHRGGAILPGPRMMVSSLLAGTAGIDRRARNSGATRAARDKGRGGRGGLFARSTRDAIEEGARYAVASAVDRAAAEARRVLGRAPQVLLTGGGAEELEPLIQARHRCVPDLVLRGVAAVAGLARRA